MKAEYKIALVSPLGDGYSALSNMNVVSRVDDTAAGTRTTNFAVSRPMSTYLAVFIVSDFVAVSDVVRTNGVGENFILSVYSTPHQVGKLGFALETGVKVTEFYLDYFRIEYPLPKLGRWLNFDEKCAD
jgi:glutamyl aminopeptidase